MPESMPPFGCRWCAKREVYIFENNLSILVMGDILKLVCSSTPIIRSAKSGIIWFPKEK